MCFHPSMPPSFRRVTLVAAALLLPCVSLAQAPAQPPPSPPRGEVQERFLRAVTLFSQRNFEGALAEFERVYQLTGSVDLLFNIGRTHEALGRYHESAAAVEEYLRRSANLPAERRAEVERVLVNVRRYIAYLQVTVAPAGASLRIDGRVVDAARRAAEIPVSPGRHRVEAMLDGYRADAQDVVVASGDHRAVQLALRVDASQSGTFRVEGAPADALVFVDGTLVRPPAAVGAGSHGVRVEAEGRAPWIGPVEIRGGVTRTLRVDLARRDQLAPAPFYATAVGAGVFLALSGVCGAMTLSTRSEFDTLTRDDPRAVEVAGRGDTLRTLTNVSLGLGLASAAAAVYLAFRTRFGPERPSTGRVVLHGDGVAVRF